MGDLTGQTVASTYSQLLNVASLDGTFRNVTDGDGTASGLTLSTTGVRAGTLNATGAVTFDTTLGVTGAITATGGVTGDVTGNVTGNITGDSTGDLTGNIKTTDASAAVTTILNANVGSDSAATFTGNITGDVTGNLTGDITGNLTGDIKTTDASAAVTTILNGNVGSDDAAVFTGNVTGDTTGNVTATSVLANGVTATTQSSSDNSTKVATTAYADAAGAAGSPTGSICQYAASSPPAGWLLCDGTAVPRATYSALHNVLKDVGGTDSYAYGNGNGSTTFNLPNLNGKVPVGFDSSQTSDPDLADLGNTGGSNTHTLITSEMPSHSHSLTLWTDDGSGGDIRADMASNYDDNTGTVSTNPTGGGTAHNNLQPYIVLNYIIKT